MSAKFGTLRYPNAQLERDSDFLEIKVVQYEPPGFDTNANQGVRLRSSSDSLKKNIETHDNVDLQLRLSTFSNIKNAMAT